MSGELLQTKFYTPRLRPNLVPRHNLTTKLNRGLQRGSKLTLVSAPAGFGKTTLITEWIASAERPSGWLALDERDNDLTRFLTYLIAALRTAAPSVGARALEMLEAAQPLPTESILTTLVNEIAATPNNFFLVLDDYHMIDAPPVDQALAFLLEHLPPQLHLILTTREDPQLPLPRLRVRGHLTELRAADLRFTEEETAVFLNQIMALKLSAQDVAALEMRTEGWVAGLQLAAIAMQSPLSMQGRADAHGFIQAFAGDNRYIVDYLVDEVLLRQPEHVRRFLLQTSILDRLSGPLCDAVRFAGANMPPGEIDGSVLLERLERGNLFVVPLDDKRQWYRYHHLFADVLQAHLMREQPDRMAVLHQRASAWYDDNELTADAVHHAFAANDLARVARIAELAWAEMDRNRQSAEWMGWVQKLPDDLLRVRPVLSVGCAWALLDTGQLEAAMRRLEDAEQCLENPANLVVADEEEFQVLPGTIAAARTYHALALGDLADTIKYAQEALDHFPEEEHHRRGTPAALLGLASWASGDLTAALHSFSEGLASYEKAGNILYVITGAYVLADMKLAQGHLREALEIYEESLQLAEEHGEPVRRGAADLYTGLSELYLEQNDLKAAQEYLLKSKALGEETALPRWRYRWCLAQARIMAAKGKLDEALDALDEAERQYVRGPVPDVRTPAALKVRVWAAQGRLAEAQRWVDAQDLAVDDDLSYLREFDHITLARLLIAQYKHDQAERAADQATALLARLLDAAEAGGRMGSVLEILVQQALAYAAQSRIPQALASLERALTLAETEGYIRTFVNEGQPVATLLKKIKAEGSGPQAYVSKLLASFARQSVDETPAASAQPLVEPLSDRELEVLQLVAEGLTNRQIAERLYLALSTVKGHNRVIYGKLNVSRRTEAVARARELGLL